MFARVLTRVEVAARVYVCAANMPYYAVAIGTTPGVYTSWPECKAQVENFKKPKFRKFATQEEAENFVREEGNQGKNNRFAGKSNGSKNVASISHNESSGSLSPTLSAMRDDMNDLERKFTELKKRFDDYIGSSSRSFHTSAVAESKKRRASSDDDSDDNDGHKAKKLECSGENSKFKVNNEGYLVVYTDGACESNGRMGAKAGVGVYFGPGHPMNVSEPVRGRATNNTAEIQAATYALELAHATGFDKVVINTDSQFVINCVEKWMKSWKKNGWKKKDGTQVINKEDLKDLDKASSGLEVKWVYVQGHMGNIGNEAADRLARDGAQRYQADM
ncbi:ribonuclease H1-like [Oratosquilla oratoria]|uniref:ribonuclease H1-like n=1 Tax=Oratosquilla oratoria TaxID=337810 RepID=UPI003F75E8BC